MTTKEQENIIRFLTECETQRKKFYKERKFALHWELDYNEYCDEWRGTAVIYAVTDSQYKTLFRTGFNDIHFNKPLNESEEYNRLQDFLRGINRSGADIELSIDNVKREIEAMSECLADLEAQLAAVKATETNKAQEIVITE